MNDIQALERAHYYLNQHGQPWTEPLTLHNFERFYGAVVDCIKQGMSAKQRAAIPIDWAERFAALADDRDAKVKSDPCLLYLPRTTKHQAFHDSQAFIRYLISANGIGKTLMCYMELIWCATGQRHYNGKAGNAAVVSTGHAGYSQMVFDRKLVYGEDDDPYSPYVPPGGYWYHSFDKRDHVLRMACEHCAEAGKPTKCTHTKELRCLSADSGKDRLMGFTATRALADEHIPEDVWNEIIQRIIRIKDGRLMVAATPLAGPDSWEVRSLYNFWKKRPAENWRSLSDHSLGRYVDVFQISKFDCIGTHNGPTLESIEMERRTLPDSEFRVRVMGEPIPLGNSLFDLSNLDNMEKEEAREPEYGQITLGEVGAEDLEWAEDVVWNPEVWTSEEQHEGNRVWEHPVVGAQYVMGCDVASGVGSADRDASAAYVFKVVPDNGQIKLEMVAAHYSYLDVYAYAVEAKKLAIYYNQALVIPETTGIGATFMTVMGRQLFYPAMFLGDNKGEQVNAAPDSNFGVNTGATNKPLMVGALHSYIGQRRMIVRDKEAISECRTFQRERSESGLSFRYAAANGAHDDRVMAMALVAYAAANHPDQVFTFSISPTKKPGGSGGTPGPQPKPKAWVC